MDPEEAGTSLGRSKIGESKRFLSMHAKARVPQFLRNGIDTNNGQRFGARVEPALIMIGLKLLVTQVLSTSYSCGHL